MRPIRNAAFAALFGLCVSSTALAETIADPNVKNCFTNEQCASSEFCDKSASCVTEVKGQCKRKPKACINQDLPVSACDGKKYTSLCRANMAGTSVPVLSKTAKQ